MSVFLSWVASNLLISAVLATAAFALSRWFKNPHLAHGLWLLVLLKLLTPPIWVCEISWVSDSKPSAEEHSPALPAAEPVSVPTPAVVRIDNPDEQVPQLEETTSEVLIEPAAEREVSFVPPSIEPSPRPASTSLELPQVLLLIWAMGSAVFAGLIVIRCRQFQKLLALARPAEESLQHEVRCLCGRLGIRRCPKVLLIDAQVPPLVWGLFGRPRILLPRQLFDQLSSPQRLSVLAHELAHIARRDPLFRWIEVSAVALFWWYPIAWWAARELRRSEEECCDALVIWALPEARQDYGKALCRAVEFLANRELRLPEVVGGTLGSAPLKRRIEMIMNRTVPHRMSWKVWGIMLLIAAAALPVAAQISSPERSAKSEEPQANTPALPEEQPKTPKVLESPAPPSQEPKTATENTPAPPEEGPKEAESYRAVLKPVSDVRLSSLHGGKVLKTHVSEGDQVKEGQILLEIRNTELELRHQEAIGELADQREHVKSAELAVRQAQVAVTPAVENQSFTARLHEKGVVSNAQLRDANAKADQARLNLEQAKGELQAAQQSLENLSKRAELAARLVEELTIKAPNAGIVLELEADAGELVRANVPVTRIVAIDSLTAEAFVSDPNGLLNQTVEISVPQRNGQYKKYPAKVTFVSPIANPVSGTFEVRCTFKNEGPNGERLAHPGQAAIVTIPGKK